MFLFYLLFFYRLLAFGLDFVSEDDIIMTADVDAFIMTQQLLCFCFVLFFRLLAFGLDFVGEDDIIVTADVDAFIMTKDILLPLKLVNKK